MGSRSTERGTSLPISASQSIHCWIVCRLFPKTQSSYQSLTWILWWRTCDDSTSSTLFNICCVLSFELGLIKPSWSALIARWGGCRPAPTPLRCARALRTRHPTLRFGGENKDRSEGPVGRIGVGYTVHAYTLKYTLYVMWYTYVYIQIPI